MTELRSIQPAGNIRKNTYFLFTANSSDVPVFNLSALPRQKTHIKSVMSKQISIELSMTLLYHIKDLILSVNLKLLISTYPISIA